MARNRLHHNDAFALTQYNVSFNSETQQMKRILDAKYKKSNLEAISEISTHLDPQERNKLHTLLKKYESLFDGDIGKLHGEPYDIKLKPDKEPYHGRPFTVPHIHELTLKQELDQLKDLYVINKLKTLPMGRAGISHTK